MESSAEYLIVSASLRPNSRSRVMAHYLADCYRDQGIATQMIDLRDTALPFCDGEAAYDHQEVKTLAKSISAARVIVVATPIYNFDASAALKNLVELTGDSWENKVVGFLCAAGGSPSYMSVMSLANSLMLDFRCLIIPRFVFATGEDFVDWQLSSAEVQERIRELAAASTRIRNDQR
ncbi:MAG: NAD(P)H-dependent oxidoreductase [Verrucomicrobia bacterium]|jgi:NAD(P)H-dependent FMN reductase|nr:NAD(P)H-dependent oxidoreductase [Verrucomicrobiota bacterium]